MTIKLSDLDDLERKATAAIAAEADAPRTLEGKPQTTQETADTSWAHQSATEPPVTLALIARIRGLETIARERLEQNERMCREIERLDAIHGRVATVADEAFGQFPMRSAEENLTAIERGVFDLRQQVAKLEAQIAAQQLVVDAADSMVRVKHEAEKVFRTGLSGMYALTQSSPVASGLAKATAAAGKKLEQVVLAHRKRSV